MYQIHNKKFFQNRSHIYHLEQCLVQCIFIFLNSPTKLCYSRSWRLCKALYSHAPLKFESIINFWMKSLGMRAQYKKAEVIHLYYWVTDCVWKLAMSTCIKCIHHSITQCSGIEGCGSKLPTLQFLKRLLGLTPESKDAAAGAASSWRQLRTTPNDADDPWSILP